MPTIFYAVLTLLTLLLASPATADWPQIRGPERDGLAAAEELAKAWGDDGPPEMWRQAIGAGFSGISVSGETICTQATYELGDREMEGPLCLDAATGRTLWHVLLGERLVDQFGDGPRSTPVIDGNIVYAVTGTLQLAALTLDGGEVLWQYDLRGAFEAAVPRFGFSPSPLIDGEQLLLEVGGKDGNGIVAFDKRTGNVLWTALDGPAGHSSPVVVEIGGERQYVFNRRAGTEVVAISTSGERLWSHPSAPDTIVMPLFASPDRFFLSSAAMGDGGTMIRVAKTDAGYEVEKLWQMPRMRNHFNTSVIVGEHLYGFDNSTFRCLDLATGEAQWAMRGFGKGSIVATQDLLIVLGDTGKLALVEVNPESYVELARTEVLEGRTWTPPTLSGGRLFVRDHDEIVALAVGAERVAASATAAPISGAPTPSAEPVEVPDSVESVLRRYAEARGGVERWRAVKSLEMKGTYSTFSEWAPFALYRLRGEERDYFRIEHQMLGGDVIKAQDGDGPWWQFPILGAEEPGRVPIPGYVTQLERFAQFEPPLLGAVEKGYEVKLLGAGEVDGRPTIDVELSLGEGQTETWKLDPETFLEVAVDATVLDFTQAREPISERTFYGDFREVEGLMLPFRVVTEFAARLEEMLVESVEIGAEIETSVFKGPDAPPPSP